MCKVDLLYTAIGLRDWYLEYISKNGDENFSNLQKMFVTMATYMDFNKDKCLLNLVLELTDYLCKFSEDTKESISNLSLDVKSVLNGLSNEIMILELENASLESISYLVLQEYFKLHPNDNLSFDEEYFKIADKMFFQNIRK